MKALSTRRINSNAPYEVKESKQEGFYEFFTAHDVHYSIGFLKEELLIQEDAYQLIILTSIIVLLQATPKYVTPLLALLTNSFM